MLSLDSPLHAVCADPLGFHRLLSSMAMNGAGSYHDAYLSVSSALADNPRATVRKFLEPMQLTAIAEDVHTLEQRDAARDRINRRAAELVKLDGDELPRISPDDYAAVRQAGSSPDYRRLLEARQLSADEYLGEAGEQRFAADDRMHAESGVDLVGLLRRNVAARSAQQAASQAIRKLDQAIERGGTPGDRRRLLSAATSEGLRMLDAELGAAPTVPEAKPAEGVKQLDAAVREGFHRLGYTDADLRGWGYL